MRQDSIPSSSVDFCEAFRSNLSKQQLETMKNDLFETAVREIVFQSLEDLDLFEIKRIISNCICESAIDRMRKRFGRRPLNELVFGGSHD